MPAVDDLAGLLMRSVTCSMGVTADSYIVGPDGDCDWTAPDEEVFRFVTDEMREVGGSSSSPAPPHDPGADHPAATISAVR